MHQLSHFTTLAGSLVLDVGGGPGYFRTAFRQAGAHYLWVEPDISELSAGGIVEPGRVLGSALDMPFATASVDICYSSNVLEHVPDPWRMCEEMVRVTRPGGVIFLSFTNWLSPWGGHETAPWHYLGGHRAARRYERRTGTPPKNRYGSSLFPVAVADALEWALQPSRDRRRNRHAALPAGLDQADPAGPGPAGGRHLEPGHGLPPALTGRRRRGRVRGRLTARAPALPGGSRPAATTTGPGRRWPGHPGHRPTSRHERDAPALFVPGATSTPGTNQGK